MTEIKKCIIAMIFIIVSLIILLIYLLIINNKHSNASFENVCGKPKTEPKPRLIKHPRLDSEMRREYYNEDVRFIFIYNPTNETRYKHKCIALKCQNACDAHYHANDAIAPLSICLNEYNYCQCLRYTELLNVDQCETYDCNVNCIGSGHDYGICNYNNSGCYCFNTLNFRNGITKTRWEKKVEYFIVKTNLHVLLLDLAE